MSSQSAGRYWQGFWNVLVVPSAVLPVRDPQWARLRPEDTGFPLRSMAAQRCAYSALLCGRSPIPCGFIWACPAGDGHFRLKSRGGALKCAHLLATCFLGLTCPHLSPQGGETAYGRRRVKTVFSFSQGRSWTATRALTGRRGPDDGFLPFRSTGGNAPRTYNSRHALNGVVVNTHGARRRCGGKRRRHKRPRFDSPAQLQRSTQTMLLQLFLAAELHD
jgi:hypothetical protein